MSEWQVVKKKKKGKSAGRIIHSVPSQQASAICTFTQPSYSVANSNDFSVEKRDKLLKSIDGARTSIKNSKMLQAFKQSLQSLCRKHGYSDSFNDMLVYGLGSLDSSISRYQLWLNLQVVEVYDPVFSELDKKTLQHLGVFTLEQNEHAARALSEPTLVYMPHCEVDLNENIVATNALQKSLRNLVLISNHLPRYRELCDDCSEYALGYRKPATIIDLCFKERIIWSQIEEGELESTRAFNDTSIHFFLDSES